MLVIGLHTAYLAALFLDWLGPQGLVWLALAAYATYVVNALQFVLKLRAARLQGGAAVSAAAAGAGAGA
jgi:3-vinyl bacteriochlorophyllide hydratase